MKISISHIAWHRNQNKQIVELLKKFNIDTIEVAPTMLFDNPLEVSDREIDDVKAFWDDNGIKMHAMQSLLYNGENLALFKTEEMRQNMYHHLVKIIKLAAKLDVKILVFGSPRNRLIVIYDNVKKIAKKFFTEIAEVAKEFNILFCIEPNAQAYDCNFITNVDQAIALVKYIDHPHFKMMVDLSTVIANQDIVSAEIQKALPHMKHCHISEPFLKPIIDRQHTHNEIAACLHKNNYSGAVSIEINTNKIDNNLILIENSLEIVTGHYKKIIL